jgi:hypothetical protein
MSMTSSEKDSTQPNWKIVLPKSMTVDTAKWFHQVIGHPGEKGLQKTLNQRYCHPKKCNLTLINRSAKICQKHKLAGHLYGLLPKQEVQIAP